MTPFKWPLSEYVDRQVSDRLLTATAGGNHDHRNHSLSDPSRTPAPWADRRRVGGDFGLEYRTPEELARQWQRPSSSVISVQQPELSVKVSLTARSRATLTEDPGRSRSQ